MMTTRTKTRAKKKKKEEEMAMAVPAMMEARAKAPTTKTYRESKKKGRFVALCLLVSYGIMKPHLPSLEGT
jgi:hypothetical protein